MQVLLRADPLPRTSSGDSTANASAMRARATLSSVSVKPPRLIISPS